LTTPKVKTISRSGSRFYVNPESGRKNPGVTSVLNMLPKGFLKFWAAKVAAEYAVDNLGSVVGLAMNDRQAAIDAIKGAPNRFTGKAADVGSEAHDYFEKMAKGEPIGRVHPDLAPFVQHFQEFLDLCQPEFLFMEETVWSDDLGTAGSFDAMAVLRGDGAGPLKGKSLVMDWKTTRSGVHEEVALQLAAYRNAEHLVRPDGSRVPMPAIDGAAVLHVRPEGWALYPVETGTVVLAEPVIHEPTGDVVTPGVEVEVIDYFRALREVFDWEQEVKKHVIGKPITASDAYQAKPTPINKPAPRGPRKTGSK
jgi:hypothetical protein